MKALLWRELRLAVRVGSGTALGMAFFLIMVLVTALGLGRDPALMGKAAAGTLWVGALLATLLSLDRLFQADFEDGTLEAMSLAPMPLEAMAVIKILAHWLTTGLPLVVIAPLMAVMMQMETGIIGWLLASLATGTLSLSSIGSVGAAVTVGIRRGGLLLTLLVAPLFVPTLVFGVEVVREAQNGFDPLTSYLLLSGLTLFTLVLAPIAAAYALRINMT